MTLDNATPVNGATIPIRMTNDVNKTQIPGESTNGMAIIGLRMIGKPNMTGSVILKIDVAMDNLPKLLYCLDLLIRSIFRRRSLSNEGPLKSKFFCF